MRVLVATDGSEASLRASTRFLELARHEKHQIRVLTVLSYSMYPYALVAGEHLSNEKEASLAVHEKVEELTGPSRRLFTEAGDEVTVAHRFGNPGDEILAEIAEWEPDVAVIGKRGLKGLARWLGSVSEHVIHRSKVPILVVP